MALDEGGKQFREEEACELGIKIFRTCDLNSLQKKVLHYKKIKRLLKENGPYDVIHSNMDLFNGVNFLAAKQVGIPIRICHSHNSFSQYATTNLKKIILFIYKNLMKFLINQTATLKLGCSSLANNYLYGKKWENDPVCKVLYNGIDMEKFCNKKCVWGASKEYKFITVGRFINQKNPFFLVDVIDALKNRGMKNIKLTWVGDGILKEKVIKYAKELGIEDNIIFLGLRKDIPELLREHTYFLMPSLFEGLPIALLEAQASGIKCFVSDNVPKEVNAGLCTYISLERTAKEWAEIIEKEIELKNDFVLDIDKIQMFDVKNTIAMLKKYYDS